MQRPYLMVYERPEKHDGPTYIGQWMDGPYAAKWIKLRSNEKRRNFDLETGEPLEWLDGELAKAKLYKMQNYSYDSLTEIYSSDSLIAQNFKEGVASIRDVLWEIEW